MSTNGTLLKKMDALKIADVFDVVVSIDDPREYHDKIRVWLEHFKKPWKL